MQYKVEKKIKYFDSKSGLVIEHKVGDVIDYTQPTWESMGMVKAIKVETKSEEKAEEKAKPQVKNKKK